MITGLIIALAYIGLVLFIARFASDKWHPDGGADR